MSVYHIVLFVHVTGAMSLVAAHVVMLVCLTRIRRATRVEQIREFAPILHGLGRAIPISLVVIAAAGLYMATTAWGFTTGWIDVALGTFILLVAIVPRVIGTRVDRISRNIQDATDGPLTGPLYARIHDPVLATGERVILLVTLGIVFLMTVKPELYAALAVIGSALALALILSIPEAFAARKHRKVVVESSASVQR